MNNDEIRKSIQAFKEQVRQMVKAKREFDQLMSLEPLEVQLEYYFGYYGWKVISTFPPDQEETQMYVHVERGDEDRDYCVPDLPGNHQLVLISAQNNLFVFAVDKKLPISQVCSN